MTSLSDYIMESTKIQRIRPVGYVDDSEFGEDKYKDYWFILLKSIAKYTPLNRNKQSNGNIWEEFLLTDKFILKAIKKTSIGKNGNIIKDKKIDERIVSDKESEIYTILFGKDIDEKQYNNFKSLVEFIVSSDYTNRDKNTIDKIYKRFLELCEKRKITNKLYKIKPWFRTKIDTII